MLRLAHIKIDNLEGERQTLGHTLQQHMELAQHNASRLEDVKSKLSHVEDKSTAAQRMLLTDQAQQTAEAQALKLKMQQAELQLAEQVRDVIARRERRVEQVCWQAAELEQLRQGGDLHATLQEREEALTRAREQATQLTLAYETTTSQLKLTQAELAEAQAAGSATGSRLTAMRELATSLGGNAQQLRVDYDVLATSVKQALAVEFRQMLAGASQAIAISAQSAIEEATHDLRAKYRFEFRQRKLLYNKLQELQGMATLMYSV